MKLTEHDKREKLVELISDLGNLDVIMLHNEYCSAAKYYDDEIFPMDCFNEMFSGCDPIEIASMVWSNDFNPKRDYFTSGVYLNAFDFWDDKDSPVCLSDIADYCLRHDDELGNDDVRDFLDELNEEEDEE